MLLMNKIVFFEYIHHYGGAQRSSIDLLLNLRHLGYEVMIIDACGSCMEFKEAVKDKNIPYYSLNREFSFNGGIFIRLIAIMKYVFNIISLYELLYKEKPLFVYTCSSKSLYSLVLCKFFLKNELLFFIRGINDDSLPTALTKFLINKYVNKVLVQSSLLKRKIEQLGVTSLIEIIPNVVSENLINFPIHLKSYTGKQDLFQILIIGTILETKGYKELLTSFLELRRIGYKIKLDIVGDYKDEIFKEWLLNFIEINSLQTDVVIHGYQKNVIPFIQNAHLFVLPSYGEGTPRSILEAMAVGVPVLATKVGGIPDMITHGESGFLISPKNYKELTDNLIYIMDNYNTLYDVITKAKIKIKNTYSNNNQEKILRYVFK